MSKRLTPQQRLFCEHYARCFNGTLAAKRAGYSERSAHDSAWRLMKNPAVQARLQELYDERGMGVSEVSARLSALARGEAPSKWKCDTDGRTLVAEYSPETALDKLAKATGLYAGEEDDRAVKILVVRSVDDVDPEDFGGQG